MKGKIGSLVLAVLLVLPIAALGHEMSKHKAAVLTGEIVDTGCYLGHAARSAQHAECATKCVNGGMPMGLLTAQGAMYLITMNHDNSDAYNKLKTMVGKTVVVTGAILSRGGMKGIDVTSFKPAVRAATG
jgi:hypothetical protein